MAEGSNQGTIMYAGRRRPVSELTQGQINDINTWTRQMEELKKKEARETKEAEEKKKEKDKGGGVYKRMTLARTVPKTQLAEILNTLYGSSNAFLKALTVLPKF